MLRADLIRSVVADRLKCPRKTKNCRLRRIGRDLVAEMLSPRVLLGRHAQRRFNDQPVAFAFRLLSSICDGMIERVIVHREATRVL